MKKDPKQQNQTYSFCIPQEHADSRLDVFIAQQFPDYSRSFFKRLLSQGCTTLNDTVIKKAGTRLKSDDMVVVNFPSFKPDIPESIPEDIDAKVVYQNDDFMIIYKPAELIVHQPHPLSTEITLVDWLLYRQASIKNVGYQERPGIVHRLDKNTSGLMIIPLHNRAHAIFSDLFKNRKIKKTYRALVHGHPDKQGTIDFSIDRDQIHKHKMTHKSIRPNARAACTKYKVLEYFDDHALVEAYPVTGRTHQIRVHLNAIGHPLIGDSVYGKPSDKLIKRHALHAYGLNFIYDGQEHSFTLELPEDFQSAYSRLKNHSRNASA